MFRKIGSRRSRAVFWHFLTAKRSPTMPTRRASRSGGRRIATGGFVMPESTFGKLTVLVTNGHGSPVSLRPRDDRVWSWRMLAGAFLLKPLRRGRRFWWGRIRLVTGAPLWCSFRAGTSLKFIPRLPRNEDDDGSGGARGHRAEPNVGELESNPTSSLSADLEADPLRRESIEITSSDPGSTVCSLGPICDRAPALVWSSASVNFTNPRARW